MNTTVVLSLGLLLSMLMAVAWAVQRLTGASGWVDTIWSFAVGAGGIAAAILADGTLERRWTAGLLIGLWALRLGSHIGFRTHGGGEDPRYEKLIRDWGLSAAWRLFLFLQVQALAAFVLVLAVYPAASARGLFPGLLDVAGVALAILALAGEALSDHQLSAFRRTADARTTVMEKGLWAWSRHPNYFFEWLFWCAWFLLAQTESNWLGVLALLAPIQMYWLLVHVSGIPPLEEHMLKSRGDQFRALQRRVNAFFPGPRRTGDGATTTTEAETAR
nr:DUF1295 domain-containing protein [uncultured Gellertiella sp.]